MTNDLRVWLLTGSLLLIFVGVVYFLVIRRKKPLPLKLPPGELKTTSQTKVQKTPETNSGSTSTTTTVTRGVGFKNANKVEFKYKERIKNFEEQLVMGKQKGWLTDQEILEFREKLDVLIDLEKTVSGKDYPKADLDKMEKMFTLYNEQFHKAATTPMAKKSVQKKPTKSSKPTSKTTK